MSAHDSSTRVVTVASAGSLRSAPLLIGRVLCARPGGFRRSLLYSTALSRKFAPAMVAIALILIVADRAIANPNGGQVVGGQATITAPDPRTLQVLQSTDRAVIEWQGFSIGADETTRFVQPSSSSIVLNRVTGGDPSRIFGSLTANGQVVLVNGSGILFGPTAKVDVAGLVASTADVRTDDFMAGRLNFAQPGRDGAAVVNQGEITVAEGGLVAMVAPGVENAGHINARLGRVALASGERFAVDLYGDGLVSLTVGANQPAVDADDRRLAAAVGNSGTIIADGGTVVLTASAASAIVDNVINMDGLIQARRIDGRGGQIVLDGGESGTARVAGTLDASSPDGAGGTIKVLGHQVALAGAAVLDASGETGGGTILTGGNWQGQGAERTAQTTRVAAGAALKADARQAGDGGTVVVWADGTTTFDGAISARGGAAGGDGGKIETSGKQSLGIGSAATVDAGAAAGEGGRWLLDPDNLTIANGGAGSLGGAGNQSIDADVVEATLATGTGVTLQASTSITVNEAIDGTGGSAGSGSDLHLDTATVNLNAAITLHAAATLSGTAGTVNVGSGGRIQNGIDVAATGADVNVAAGSYAEAVTVNKQGVTVSGENGAQLSVAAGQTGFTVAANDVTIEGMEIVGPNGSPYTAIDWDATPNSFGVSVNANVTGAMIRNNEIRNLRTGVNFLANAAGAITGNVIENTKGAMLLREDGTSIAVSGNSEGPVGNEWGVVYNLGHLIAAGDTTSEASASRQAFLLAASLDNGGMSVLDRGYARANRTHVLVDDDSTATAADDFNRGNALGNANQALGTIAAGIGAVVAGGTVNVAAGTYAESVTVNKALTLDGAGAGQTIIDPASGAGITVSGNLGTDQTVTISHLTVQGATAGGIVVDQTTTLDTLALAGVSVVDNTGSGFHIANNSAQANLENVTISDSLFAGNGSSAHIAADVNLYRYNGNATLTNVDILGTAPLSASSAGWGLQIMGTGTSAPAGTVTLNDVRIAGNYRRAHLGVQAFSNASTVGMTDVQIGGSAGGVASSNTAWGGLFASDLGGALDIGNTTFAGGTYTESWARDLALGGGTGSLAVNADDAQFAGINRADGLSLAEGLGIESRIWHAPDTAGAGLVRFDGTNLYVTSDNSIQRGINAASTGDTVKIAAGTYAENLTVNKALTLDGAGAGQTVLQSASSGAGTAISVSSASNVTLSDMTVANYQNGLLINGTSHDMTVTGMAFVDNRYGMRNGSTAKVDRFHMSDTSFSGGEIAVQTYNNSANAGSFADALFDSVSVDGATYKGFYFETANNLTLRDVTITDSGNVGGSDPSQFHQYGHAIDVNLKYAAYNAITLDNVVVENSGRSSGDASRAAIVVKTRGTPGDSAGYVANPASLASLNIIGGRIEGSDGVGLRVEDLRTSTGGMPNVSITGGTQFANNGQDIVVNKANVNATGAVFAGAADGFAIEDRVRHALDGSGRGLVTWRAGNLYVTAASGSIQRGLDAASAGDTVNVAGGTYAEDVILSRNLTMAGNGVTVDDLGSTAGTSVGLSGSWTVADGIDFAGTVALAGDTVLDTSAVDGAITFRGAITGRGAGGQDLALHAGDGTVTVHDIGTAGVAIGDLVVRGGTYDGAAGTSYVASLDIEGGDVAVGNSTVHASGNVAINSTNISGSIIGANVQVAATGSVSSTITATNTAAVSGANVQGAVQAAVVQIAATQTVNTVIVATQTASVSGADVQGSVRAPTATVAATQTVNVQVDTDSLTVSAPAGSVTGNAGTVQVASGSGVITLNDEAAAPVDSNVGRSSSVLDPNVANLELQAPAAMAPGSVAFADSAVDVFSRSFGLGIAPESVQPAAGGDAAGEGRGDGTDERTLANFLGSFWDYFRGTRTDETQRGG